MWSFLDSDEGYLSTVPGGALEQNRALYIFAGFAILKQKTFIKGFNNSHSVTHVACHMGPNFEIFDAILRHKHNSLNWVTHVVRHMGQNFEIFIQPNMSQYALTSLNSLRGIIVYQAHWNLNRSQGNKWSLRKVIQPVRWEHKGWYWQMVHCL